MKQWLQGHSLDFYLQIFAASLSLTHVYVTAHDLAPWYKLTGITLALLWCWISWLWRKWPTVALNLTLALIYVWGITG